MVLLDPFTNHHSRADGAKLLASGVRVVAFEWEPPDGRYLNSVNAPAGSRS